MKLALEQARKNLGNTSENPSVGCIITKNNSVISAGNTSIKGRPHAEVNAINLSKINVAGSEIYITLEPCSHQGITPPCTKLIVKKKLLQIQKSNIFDDNPVYFTQHICVKLEDTLSYGSNNIY